MAQPMPEYYPQQQYYQPPPVPMEPKKPKTFMAVAIVGVVILVSGVLVTSLTSFYDEPN